MELSNKRLEILARVLVEPQRWSELRDKMDLAEASLGNFLDPMMDNEILQRGIRDNKHKVYEPNLTTIREDEELKEQLINYFQSNEKLADELEKHGISTDGMTNEETVEFLVENREAIRHVKIETESKEGKSTLNDLRNLLDTIEDVSEVPLNEIEAEWNLVTEKNPSELVIEGEDIEETLE